MYKEIIKYAFYLLVFCLFCFVCVCVSFQVLELLKKGCTDLKVEFWIPLCMAAEKVSKLIKFEQSILGV